MNFVKFIILNWDISCTMCTMWIYISKRSTKEEQFCIACISIIKICFYYLLYTYHISSYFMQLYKYKEIHLCIYLQWFVYENEFKKRQIWYCAEAILVVGWLIYNDCKMSLSTHKIKDWIFKMSDAFAFNLRSDCRNYKN